MSVFDHGGAYRLEYLGSVMMMHSSTGLGMLQKPLRELYFKYRQSNTSGQEKRLALSTKGMVIAYQQNPAMMPEEVFYPMQNIVFWDGVQFVTVKGRDKKHKGGFEPLDIDHSRNKDNLFSVIEKKYNFLVKQSHPPLFTCALRRTEGVKSIDVHVFVCSSVDEALSIVHGLNELQHFFNMDAERSGAFDYKPYPQARSVASRSNENSPNSTFAPPYQGQQFGAGDPREHPYSDRGSQFGDAAVSQFSERGSQYGGRDQAPPVSPKPRFGVPAVGPQAGVVAAIGAPRPPLRHAHQQPLPPAPSHPAPTRPQAYNLTQDDFQNPSGKYSYQEQRRNEGRPEYPPDPAPQQQSKRDYRQYDVSGNNTYEYIRHIKEEEVPSMPTRYPRVDESTSPGSVYTTTLATRPQPPIHPDYREDYDSMSRDMYITDSTIQTGYRPNSGHAQDDDHYMHTIRGDKAGDRFDEFPRRPILPERSAPHYGEENNPPIRDHVYNSHLPERDLLREYTQAQNQLPQSGRNSGFNQRPASASFGENHRPLSQSSEQSSKPVAMVQPRKIQGVKVLPTIPISQRSRDSVSSSESSNRNSQVSVENGNKNSMSSHNEGPSVAYNEYYDNRGVKKDPVKKNWQFGANEASDPLQTLKAPDDKDQFKTTDEQRHQRMKKEAELASVFQEMHVEDRTFRMSDFEKGLGYLP